MIDGSEKHNRQLAFELQNSHVCEKRSNGAGIVVTNIGKMKNFKKKKEMTRIAFTTYEKVLVELRSALRGDEFNKHEFVKGLNPGVISKVG